MKTIYAYTLNYKTNKVIERTGRFRKWIGYGGKTWMFDEYIGDKRTGKYLTSLSLYEGVVRGSTVWYFKPNMDTAIEAFKEKAKSMSDHYAKASERSQIRTQEDDMSCSKWAYEPEKCEGDFCIGDCDLCNKRNESMWIDADECTPIADGDYRVVTKNNCDVLMPYTREGGWNTFYTKNGNLVGVDISEFVDKWFNPAMMKIAQKNT